MSWGKLSADLVLPAILIPWQGGEAKRKSTLLGEASSTFLKILSCVKSPQITSQSGCEFLYSSARRGINSFEVAIFIPIFSKKISPIPAIQITVYNITKTAVQLLNYLDEVVVSKGILDRR